MSGSCKGNVPKKKKNETNDFSLWPKLEFLFHVRIADSLHCGRGTCTNFCYKWKSATTNFCRWNKAIQIMGGWLDLSPACSRKTYWICPGGKIHLTYAISGYLTVCLAFSRQIVSEFVTSDRQFQKCLLLVDSFFLQYAVWEHIY